MSDYFPEEIIERILSRSPPKSLVRFTLVCKSWMSLIKSSTFIQSHLSATIQNDRHFLLLSACQLRRQFQWLQFQWLHWDTPEFGEYSQLPYPQTFLKHKGFSDLEVVGTCNGLICLAPNLSENPSPTLIWNPSIRNILVLPTPPQCLNSTASVYNEDTEQRWYHFGYDSHSNDYKVLMVVTVYDTESYVGRNFITGVQVYSLARGAWKTLDASVVPVGLWGRCLGAVYVHGCVHVADFRENGEEMFIASFDMATELFGEVVLPESLRRKGFSISKYGDSLALVKHCDARNVVDRCFDIWVMKEYGVAESWTFLYKIEVVGLLAIYGFKSCGEVVLRAYTNRPRRMFMLDPLSKEMRIFGKEYHHYYFMDSFVETLVLLDHADATSY